MRLSAKRRSRAFRGVLEKVASRRRHVQHGIVDPSTVVCDHEELDKLV